jgi:DNA-binding transcriptional LysR family regulator
MIALVGTDAVECEFTFFHITASGNAAMELYQLRTFATVADEANLTRAAKRLHTSQPAVSAQIKALEEELGVHLFFRTPKGMVLTAEGVKLREHAGQVLATVAAMEREAGAMRGVLRGELRIGINAKPELLRLAELFTAMRTQHPEVQLHLRQAMTGEVPEKLESGELDAGFMFGEVASERLFASELRQMEMVVAGPPEQKEELRRVAAKQLGNYSWIITPDNCPFHAVAASFFDRHGITPLQAALVDDESIIRMMVGNGVGLSFLLREDTLGASPEESLAVWDGERLTLPLSIACLARRQHEPLLQTLLAVLSELRQPQG